MATEHEELSRQLGDIQDQLSRIAERLDFNSPPPRKVVKKLRRRLGLKTLFAIVGICACLAAWLGSEIRHARLQSKGVDILAGQRAAFSFEPSDNLLAAVMPGTPADPPAVLRRSLGYDFFNHLSEVSVRGSSNPKRPDADKVVHGILQATQLKRVRVSLIPLNLQHVNEILSLPKLESLDVSRTGLGDGSIDSVMDTRLRWLDISHTKLGDLAAYQISTCEDLEHANFERTMLSDDGVDYLANLKKLRYLNLCRTRVTVAGVKRLAKALPDCRIVYQPLVFQANGQIDRLQAFETF